MANYRIGVNMITIEHFKRAISDICIHGDNDTLPLDSDKDFVKSNQIALANIAHELSLSIERGSVKEARNKIDSANIFSERLLAPAGSNGFRVVTKIHPFWSIYINGLCIAIAEALEPTRSERVHSYRFESTGSDLFRQDSTWRSFRIATKQDIRNQDDVVVQTDISSFYEHVYHHRLENRINDLLQNGSKVATQVDRILNKIVSGRSFGLPVGGQGSRILAEVLLAPIDQQLDEMNISWRRYVDDFVIVTPSQAEAYRAISLLSNALADYGLSLNRTKTTMLSASHYQDYVDAQIGMEGDESARLREIDLRFDPYSDDPEGDFNQLRGVVESLNIEKLLSVELGKSQPDTFLVSQISRTLRLHDASVSLGLCQTLLSARNLHAFRASWATLMRGISALRSDGSFAVIHERLDELVDNVLIHSEHLVAVDTSCLYYLGVLRFAKTPARAEYVRKLYQETASQSVKRACIECWMSWRDRANFVRLRNQWSTLSPEVQRMLWLAAKDFGDEGHHFRKQVSGNVDSSWSLGIEKPQRPAFAKVFKDWNPT